jgi:hypothetical protein
MIAIRELSCRRAVMHALLTVAATPRGCGDGADVEGSHPGVGHHP